MRSEAREDLEAFTYAMRCGCVLFATVHGSLIPGTSGKAGSEGSGQRKVVFPLHFLKNGELPGQVEVIVNEEGKRLC